MECLDPIKAKVNCFLNNFVQKSSRVVFKLYVRVNLNALLEEENIIIAASTKMIDRVIATTTLEPLHVYDDFVLSET